jgi:hypothetical protein
MLRKTGGGDLSQNEKYLSFKRAFGSINHYVSQNNFLAAYIIAFSILEDRLLASYIVCYKHKNKEDLSLRKLDNVSLSQLVHKLHYIKVIDIEFVNQLVELSDERNVLIHLMMWKLDEFNQESADKVRSAITKIEKCRRHFIKPLKPKKVK